MRCDTPHGATATGLPPPLGALPMYHTVVPYLPYREVTCSKMHGMHVYI